MKHRLLLTAAALLTVLGSQAQRVTDRLTRGLVAIPQGDKDGQDSRYGTSGSGIFLTWRMLPEEYYDTQYNVYRDGTKLNSAPLSVSNYQDNGGSKTNAYTIVPVVRGVERTDLASEAVKSWNHQYLDVKVPAALNRNGVDMTASYALNDMSVGDVDGDGQMEFLAKRNFTGGILEASNKLNFNHYECYKLDGTRLWWIDLGPNLMSGPDEQYDLILYDWDEDGRCEAVMRGADNMIIHTATGKTINVGNMNYYAPRDEYTHQGAEYLLYLNGATGEPWDWDGQSEAYTPMAYPLPRFEAGESDYAAVWGSNDTGHRSAKHYFGAPYLDGVHASIFLGRGCYTRHKMCALDVNPATHELTQRWRWNCYDGSSPWFGSGFHNFAIADCDLDGRDEIIFGAMVIDDTGKGLSTTGLGHGDSQHCTDLDPYSWGLEQFTCQEGSQGMAYRNATTSELYYRKSDGGDDGRAMAGNFQNTYPGAVAHSASSGLLSCSGKRIIVGNNAMGSDDFWNMRVYWDGDLLDEFMDSPGVERAPTVYKFPGQAEVGTGRTYANDRVWMGSGALNNSSKNNPCFLGDIIGDWREEIVTRIDASTFRIQTTSYSTKWAMPTLWSDHVYRNGMVWQPVGYNQPPQTSYFVGELEGITMAPPPITLFGRTVLTAGSTIDGTMSDQHVLLADYGDATYSVTDGASPYIVTDNAPQWVKGNDVNGTSRWNFRIDYVPYTHTLTGGAFSGETRLVKQGEGLLVLPDVVQTYTGETNVWNGSLQFSGTLQQSPLWLNRHTTLLTDGGKFLGGIKADYNATIYVGKGKKSTLETTTLKMGFGSRLVIDLYADGTADVVKADEMTFETKAWEYGPKYAAPVIQFVSEGEVADGQYLIAEVTSLKFTPSTSKLDKIIIEGISGKRHYLRYEDGQLRLVVESFRQPATITWNGTSSANTWDYGASETFLTADGTTTYNGEGDDVIFNDSAAYTTVNIKGAVRPQSITFENNTKAYTLTGDSIVGGASLTKNGKGALTVKNLNKVGNVVINGGKVTASLLANTTGQDVGSLGTVSSTITINDGGTFSLSGTAITDQQFRVSGQSTIDMPSGSTLTMHKGITGKGTLTKKGAGVLKLGYATQAYDTLVIAAGALDANENSSNVMQLPRTVVLAGGTLWDAANENTSSTNNANFVVPEGKTGTLYGDPRCNYKGSLTGSGTFIVYGTWVRCYYQGNWSQFEGTITPRLQDRSTKHGYAPAFDFQSTAGLPKATLNLEEGFTFYGPSGMQIGSVTGTGTLGGTDRSYILGTNDKDFRVTFRSEGPITKRGTGTMTISTAGYLNNTLTVGGGEVQFYHTAMSTLEHGSYATTVNSGASLRGVGVLYILKANNGSDIYMTNGTGSIPGKMKVNGTTTFASGSTMHITVRSNTRYSQLQTGSLSMNGTVAVELLDNYEPAVGDSLQIWTVTNTPSGKPKLQLPELPAGLYWDTTALLDADGKPMKNGVLKVSDDASLGITGTEALAEQTYQVFTVDGRYLTTIKATPATLRQALVGRVSQRHAVEAVIVRSKTGSRKVMLR